MKKIVSSFLFVFVTVFSANAQKALHVPHAVKHRFHHHFPNASEVTWSKEKGFYKSVFKVDKTNVVVYMNRHGHCEEITHDIDPKMVPVSASEYITKHFPTGVVKKARIIDDLTSNIIFLVDVEDKDGTISELRINDHDYDHIEIRQEW